MDKIRLAEWKIIHEYRGKVDAFKKLLKEGDDGNGGYHPPDLDEWLEAAGELREGMSTSELALGDALEQYHPWSHIAARIIIALLKQAAPARPADEEPADER